MFSSSQNIPQSRLSIPKPDFIKEVNDEEQKIFRTSLKVPLPRNVAHCCHNVAIIHPGEGHGNLLQCSCLENPTDRGAWQATLYGVTKSQTRLKQLSFQGSAETPGKRTWDRNTRCPGPCSKQATPRDSSPQEAGMQEARAQSGPKEKRDGARHTRDPSRPHQDRVPARLGCCDQHQTPGSRKWTAPPSPGGQRTGP